MKWYTAIERKELLCCERREQFLRENENIWSVRDKRIRL